VSDRLALGSAGVVTDDLEYIISSRVGDRRVNNIGVEEPEISVAELARRMADLARELVGYLGQVVQQRSNDADYLTDNPSRRRRDIAKARRELQYDPVVQLDDGLRRSLIWYSEDGS
jgi:UDP-glucuronate decarboxylase